VAAVYADENVWLSRKIMGRLYDVESPTINNHLRNIYADSMLPEDSVVQNISNNLSATSSANGPLALSSPSPSRAVRWMAGI